MRAELEGRIERITYTNDENGYTIAKLKVHGRPGLVTVVGSLIAPSPGEVLRMEGEWVEHPKYGEQFKIESSTTSAPASVYGITKYLGSGLIKGIGPVMAGRIVKKFGKDTLDVLDNDFERLSEVNGMGRKRIAMVKEAWEEQKEIREVMIFLQEHDVGTGHAVKIFKRYGKSSIEQLSENPYRLAMDIFGIGFVTADRIADKLGFPKDSQLRAEAGVLYILNQLAEEGHVYYPYEMLVDRCREALDVEREVIVRAVDASERADRIVIENMKRESPDFSDNNRAVYLARYYVCETGIADAMKRLVNAPKSVRRVDSEKALQWVQERLSISLARKQVEAVRSALESKAMVVTGGPGTGKTTIIHAVLKIFSMLRIKIMLAAPTGRAAKRMSETTGHKARTIHRMLEYSLQKGGFQRNEKKPLDCDLLIVDEASMIDTILMYHLLRAVPEGATFILVGDVNQLPSVGAGNVLGDILESGVLPVLELNEIFRQARESLIVVNAHRINRGEMPTFPANGMERDFFLIEQEDPREILETIVELAKERIPRRFGLDPVEDIQVLAPMHKGVVGAGNLNVELQKAFNPGAAGLVRGERTFRENDKVMQIRNNYDKEVFNGDIGRIIRIDPEARLVVISFEGRDVSYGYTEMDEVVLAYAVSVHKSQGSEYPAVIMPVVVQHYMLLQRNLIYTGLTRGRELVVMVGTRKALAIGVNNDRTQKRYTRLRNRLE